MSGQPVISISRVRYSGSALVWLPSIFPIPTSKDLKDILFAHLPFISSFSLSKRVWMPTYRRSTHDNENIWNAVWLLWGKSWPKILKFIALITSESCRYINTDTPYFFLSINTHWFVQILTQRCWSRTPNLSQSNSYYTYRNVCRRTHCLMSGSSSPNVFRHFLTVGKWSGIVEAELGTSYIKNQKFRTILISDKRLS